MSAPTEDQRAAVLAALPEPARGARGVASLLTELDGTLLDGAIVLDGGEVFLRPLPVTRRADLDTWLGLLERRRNQVAHDLSGPATGVLAALETVLEYEPVPASSRGILRDAHDGMLRLARLLADRSGMVGWQPSMIEGLLADIARRSLAPIVEALDPQGERLAVELEAGDDRARVDTHFLDGALGVLVTNAWKCRRGLGLRARLEVTAPDGWLQISIADDGRGLDAPSLRRAGELGFTTRSSGVGLGLFLLRRAASQRRGVVVLEGLDQGARATVIVRE